MSDTLSIGSLLKKIRIERKLSQTVFGKRIGISQALVSEVENGQTPLPEEILRGIKENLSLSKAEYQEVLLASQKITIEDTKNIGFSSLNKLLLFLEKKDVPAAIKDIVDNHISTLLGAWYMATQIEDEMRHRRWEVATTQCNEALRHIYPQTSSLQIYLKELAARAHIHLGNMSEAQRLLEGDAQLIESVESDRIKALYYIQQGNILRNQDQWEVAEKYYHQAKSIYEALKETVLAKQVDRKIAFLFLFRGNWNAARPILESCYRTFKQLDDKFEQVRTLYALAWMHNLSGNWLEAKKCHDEGLQLSRESVNDDSAFEYLELLGHSYVGNDYRQLMKLEEAEKEYKLTQKFSDKYPNDRENGWIILGQARLHAQNFEHFHISRNYPEADKHSVFAKTFFQNALDFYLKRRLGYRIVMTQVHYARFLLTLAEKQNNGESDTLLEQAESLLTDALTKANTIHCEYYIAQIKSVLCEVYRKTKRVNLIAYYVHEVEELAGHYHFYRILARLKTTLASAAIDQGHYTDAPALFSEAFHAALLYNDQTVDEIMRIFVHNLRRILASDLGRKDAKSFLEQSIEALESILHSPKFYDEHRKSQGNKLIAKIKSFADDVEFNHKPQM